MPIEWSVRETYQLQWYQYCIAIEILQCNINTSGVHMHRMHRMSSYSSRCITNNVIAAQLILISVSSSFGSGSGCAVLVSAATYSTAMAVLAPSPRTSSETICIGSDSESSSYSSSSPDLAWRGELRGRVDCGQADHQVVGLVEGGYLLLLVRVALFVAWGTGLTFVVARGAALAVAETVTAAAVRRSRIAHSSRSLHLAY